MLRRAPSVPRGNEGSSVRLTIRTGLAELGDTYLLAISASRPCYCPFPSFLVGSGVVLEVSLSTSPAFGRYPISRRNGAQSRMTFSWAGQRRGRSAPVLPHLPRPLSSQWGSASAPLVVPAMALPASSRLTSIRGSHRVSRPRASADLPPLRMILWESNDASHESAPPALPTLVQGVQVMADRSAPAPPPEAPCLVDPPA